MSREIMKITDSFCQINGDDTVYEMPSGGINILASDGRTMLTISQKDNVFHISTVTTCKHNGRVLDDRFTISPVASNCIDLTLIPYIPYKERS